MEMHRKRQMVNLWSELSLIFYYKERCQRLIYTSSQLLSCRLSCLFSYLLSYLLSNLLSNLLSCLFSCLLHVILRALRLPRCGLPLTYVDFSSKANVETT
jgi:hypothetical protein